MIEPMRILMNGEPREIPAQSTIADLLQSLEVNVAHVAVERNQELVTRRDHAKTYLAEGDTLEIVTLVGGG